MGRSSSVIGKWTCSGLVEPTRLPRPIACAYSSHESWQVLKIILVQTCKLRPSPKTSGLEIITLTLPALKSLSISCRFSCLVSPLMLTAPGKVSSMMSCSSLYLHQMIVDSVGHESTNDLTNAGLLVG